MHGPQSTRRRKQTNRLKALIAVREVTGERERPALCRAVYYEAPERDPRRRTGRRAPWASVGVPATLCGGEPSLPRAARARVRPAGPIGKSLYWKMGELGLRGACRTDSRP